MSDTEYHVLIVLAAYGLLDLIVAGLGRIGFVRRVGKSALSAAYVIFYLTCFLGISVAGLLWVDMLLLAADAKGRDALTGLALVLVVSLGGLWLTPRISKRSNTARAVAFVIGLYVSILLGAGVGIWTLADPSTWNGKETRGRQMQVFFAWTLFVCLVVRTLARRVEMPLPRLEVAAGEQAELVRFVGEIAARCGVAPPDRIYWLEDAAAWAAQTGGWFGVGGHRVLAIGLPLLRVLTRGEFEAVLAHEMAHFHRGDTRMGSWIFRARSDAEYMLEQIRREEESVKQTPQAFHKRYRSGGWVDRMLLSLYVRALFRLSRTVMREREFEADRFAAEVTSGYALSRALCKTIIARRRWRQFQHRHLAPLLEAGFCPPVTDGFFAYYDAKSAERADLSAFAAGTRYARQEDAHPSLADRIAALRGFPETWQREAVSEAAAMELVAAPGAVERLLYARYHPKGDDQRMEDAFLAGSERKLQIQSHLKGLGLEARALGDLGGFVEELPGKLLGADRSWPAAVERAETLLATACAVALWRSGRSVVIDASWNVNVTLGSTVFSPLDAVRDLSTGRMTAAAWKEFVSRHDVAELPLVRVRVPRHEKSPAAREQHS